MKIRLRPVVRAAALLALTVLAAAGAAQARDLGVLDWATASTDDACTARVDTATILGIPASVSFHMDRQTRDLTIAVKRADWMLEPGIKVTARVFSDYRFGLNDDVEASALSGQELALRIAYTESFLSKLAQTQKLRIVENKGAFSSVLGQLGFASKESFEAMTVVLGDIQPLTQSLIACAIKRTA